MATTALPEAWQYPPELLEHAVDAIARLNRGKADVLDFFRGAGVPERFLSDLALRVATDRSSVTKFEIVRVVLKRVNEAGDPMIRQRREILNRIVRTESFDHCWENDRLAARGAVDAVRKVVGERDAFTRLEAERKRERDKRVSAARAEVERREEEQQQRKQVGRDLGRLFGESDPWARGKQLEGVMNRLFALDGMGVRHAFHLSGDGGEGIVEQIDGVIVIDGEVYLVEMKWLSEPVGVAEIARHSVRLMSRSEARGLFISASQFSAPAIAQATELLQHKVWVLCELEEIVLLLEQPDVSVTDYFREKIHAAIIEKRPLHRPTIK